MARRPCNRTDTPTPDLPRIQTHPIRPPQPSQAAGPFNIPHPYYLLIYFPLQQAAERICVPIWEDILPTPPPLPPRALLRGAGQTLAFRKARGGTSKKQLALPVCVLGIRWGLSSHPSIHPPIHRGRDIYSTSRSRQSCRTGRARNGLGEWLIRVGFPDPN